jgi:hypothetical protein
MKHGLVLENFIGKKDFILSIYDLLLFSCLFLIIHIEAPLNFKPTYKFDIGTDIYDTSAKKRIPSWTDRILYKPSENIACVAYNSDVTIMTSDHKPVYATFLVGINTYVSLDTNQNAIVTNPTKMKFTSESQVCTIM